QASWPGRCGRNHRKTRVWRSSAHSSEIPDSRPSWPVPYCPLMTEAIRGGLLESAAAAGATVVWFVARARSIPQSRRACEDGAPHEMWGDLMLLIRGLSWLILFQLIGTALNVLFLPFLPSAIIGMVLLVLVVRLRGRVS